jgi:hypothetical protein
MILVQQVSSNLVIRDSYQSTSTLTLTLLQHGERPMVLMKQILEHACKQLKRLP